MKFYTALVLLIMGVALSTAAGAQTSASNGASATKAPVMKRMRGDVDGDDRVSKDEFMNNYEKAFASIDTDEDGYISRDEQNAANAKHAQMMKKASAGTAPEPAQGEQKSFMKRFFGKKD